MQKSVCTNFIILERKQRYHLHYKYGKIIKLNPFYKLIIKMDLFYFYLSRGMLFLTGIKRFNMFQLSSLQHFCVKMKWRERDFIGKRDMHGPTTSERVWQTTTSGRAWGPTTTGSVWQATTSGRAWQTTTSTPVSSSCQVKPRVALWWNAPSGKRFVIK